MYFDGKIDSVQISAGLRWLDVLRQHYRATGATEPIGACLEVGLGPMSDIDEEFAAAEFKRGAQVLTPAADKALRRIYRDEALDFQETIDALKGLRSLACLKHKEDRL
jgi:hypothetical protein